MFVITAVLQALLLRVSPVLLALGVSHRRLGLLNQEWMPLWLRFALAILLLDLLHYATHRLFHAVHFLWRVHEVHHSDPDYDVSTAARFHPLEILPTQGAYLGLVFLLAPPPLAVFASELLSMLLNFFAHANATLPPRLEKALQWLIITPQLHRIHHSDEVAHQSRNFGQTFTFWDRVFGSLCSGVETAGKPIRTGVKGVPGDDGVRLSFMLREPFRARQR